MATFEIPPNMQAAEAALASRSATIAGKSPILYSGPTESPGLNQERALECQAANPDTTYTIHQTEAGQYLDQLQDAYDQAALNGETFPIEGSQINNLWQDLSSRLVQEAGSPNGLAFVEGTLREGNTFMARELSAAWSPNSPLKTLNGVDLLSLKEATNENPAAAALLLGRLSECYDPKPPTDGPPTGGSDLAADDSAFWTGMLVAGALLGIAFGIAGTLTAQPEIAVPAVAGAVEAIGLLAATSGKAAAAETGNTLPPVLQAGQQRVDEALSFAPIAAQLQIQSMVVKGELPPETLNAIPSSSDSFILKAGTTFQADAPTNSDEVGGIFTNRDVNGNLESLSRINIDEEGSQSATTVNFNTLTGSVSNIQLTEWSAAENGNPPVPHESVSILDTTNSSSSTSVGPNQFYVDSTKYDLTTWADVANALGVPEAELRAANPGSESIPSPADTVINLTTIDNGPAPVPTVATNPTAIQQHVNETNSETNTSSGYSENSPTVSVKFNNNKLNNSDLVSLIETSMGTGGTRPGAFQSDPYFSNQAVFDISNYGFGQNSTVGQRLNDAAYFGRLSSPFSSGYYMDPILLDLSGNGIGTTSYKDNAVLFDMDHSGSLKRTSWADEQTGILVKPDLNGNVTNISQLFSEYYGGTAGTGGNAGSMPFVNGFAALASEDTNHDGKITSNDTIWSQLKVWVDSNHDATVNAGELKTLISLGITQFNTSNFLGHETNNGNPITAESTFIMSGNTRTMSDLNLISEASSHTFTTQGSGTLDTTVTKDHQGVVKTVKTYQENSSANSTLNAATLNVDNVDGGVGNDTLIAKSTGSWLIGGGGSNTYQGGIGNDVFVISSLDGPANVHGGGGEDMVMVGSASGMTINMAQMDVTIAEGGAGNDVIMSGGRSAVYIKGGSDGNDLLIGGAGNDVITGGGGHNTIIGGTGKAIIYAGPNGDLIYGAKGDSIINAGKGNDTIVGGIGNDVIKVGMGNANIDGGGGTNIVQLHGSYGDYKITKTSAGFWISDKVTNRDGTVFTTNVQKLNFADIQAIDLNSVFAMPVKDTLTTNSTGGKLNRTQTHLISAAQLLANDQTLSSSGPLHISAVSKAVGGTVLLTGAGDVQFTPDSTYTGIMSFRYTVVDAQGHSAINVLDSATGQNAIMNAKVTLATPDVPTDSQVPQEWFISDANILPVWQDYTGKGVRIGQFEPGGPFAVDPEILNYNHPDLAPNVDIPWLTTQEVAGTLPTAYSNHATMVAGIMVAALNGTGSVGVAYDAKIGGEYYDGKITSLSTLAQFDVANNSWSATPNFAVSNLDPATSQSTGDFLLANAKYAAFNGRGGKGTVIVESAGNGRQNQESAQGSIVNNNRFSLQVGGINAPGDLSTLDPVSTPFSNAGASLLVSAPASNIVSTSQLVITSQGSIYGSDSSVMDGTSFATPIVSGIVALMLEANPNLGYRDVQEILAISARKVNDSNTTWTTNTGTHWNGGGMHTSQDYGFGNVDALAAVRLAETWLGQKTGSNESVVAASSSTVKNVTAGNTLSSTVTMASGIQVEHAEVDVDLIYGHLKDVTVKLVSPNGTQSILLSNNNPSNTSTTLKYTFMSTHDWGEKSGGSWTLQVTDSATGSPITLKNWALRLYGSTAVADDTYIYTNEYASQVALNSARATLNDVVNGTTGGLNTINAATISGNSSINLTTGAASLGGKALTIQNPTSFNNLFTGDGNDTLVANSSKGILDGGRGVNTLTGGASKNIFVVHQRTNGLDTIINFSVAQSDKFDLVGFGGLSFSSLTRTQQGADVLIGGLGNGQTILVKNITVSALTTSQFAFQDSFVAPDGFTTSASSNDNLVTGTGTVNLVGGFNNTATADTSNGKLSYTLSGTVYRHDLATADNFVIANPATWPNFKNALQGFKPGIDKIDLSVVGIPDASYLFLKPKDYVLLNTSPLVHGVEVTFWDGTQDVPLVYLDSLETTQLKASDFIFANGLPGPDAPIAAETPVTPSHRVPLDTDGTDNPFLVGSNNGVTISPDGTTVTSSVDYVLPNTINKLVFTGTDALVGTGNNNGDMFTSNSGADTFIGGTGNDTYIVNNSNVVTLENAGGGTDSIQASVNYALNDNVENLTLAGTGSINGTGNTLNNLIAGNNGNNVLMGGAGNDTLAGGAGSNTYVYANGWGNDTINPTSILDTVDMSAVTTNLTATMWVTTGNEVSDGTNTINWTAPIENLKTGSGNDTINADNGNNSLSGGAGNDVINANLGNDTLDGGAGADTLIGSQGNDTYRVDNIGDVVTEKLNEGSDTVQSSITYTLGNNVENLTLTGTGSINGAGNTLNNLIAGNNGNNVLMGGAGNDTLAGGAGNDTLIAGTGNDTYVFANGLGTDSIRDAGGSNLLNFSAVTGDLTYNAVTGTVISGTGVVNWNANTTSFSQILGAAGNNTLTGGAGNETLTGGVGNDTLTGVAGNDSLVGGSGNDNYTFASGFGNDSISDTSGNDTLDFSAFSTGLTLNLTGTSFTQSTGNSVNWSANSIENLMTGSGDDTLTGTSGANLLMAGTGNNTLTGGAGNDTLVGGTGNDTYVFVSGSGVDSLTDAGGTDTLDFRAETSAVTFTAGSATVGSDAVAWNTANTSIEQVLGGSGNDLLTGGTGNETLSGGTGNDLLNGGAGNNVYAFSNNWGSDTINSSSGTDTVDLSAVTRNLSVTMWATAGPEVSDGTSAIHWSVNNIENLNTGSGNDTINADNGNNILSGGAGNDIINANDGNDTLTGGAGNDTLNGGADNDTYLFGNGFGLDSITDVSGIDTLDFTAETNSVTFNAAAGTASAGSDSVRWTTSGTILEQVLGGSGNDLLTGGAGNETLSGGTGNDLLNGGAGNNVYAFSNNWGSDTINSSSGTDTVDLSAVTRNLSVTMWATAGPEVSDGTSAIHWSVNNIENLNTGSGNDTINADNGNNILSSGAGNDIINANDGNDTLNGGAGNDTLNGGAGSNVYGFSNNWGSDLINPTSGLDTVDLSAVTASLNVTLWSTAGNEVSDGLNTMNWNGVIANINLGSGNDVLNADNGHNSILGGAGNDVLNGNGGNDTLNSGAGNDTLNGGIGNDWYRFALGDGQDLIQENDSTSGNLDTVRFNNTVNKSNVAFFMLNGNLQMGYVGNSADLITVQGQNTASGSVERFQASDGTYMTNADVNAVIQSMTTYATNNGISLTSLNDVKNNTGLMSLVAAGWHS